MSGIAGILHFDGRPVEPGQVEAMTAAMHYRGPDGIHHWRRGNVALGQCMLRTTPESLEETQPLTNEDESLVLVMDGRVDNCEELRRELQGKGAVLRSRADAELVLRAYAVWGRDCLRHIDGDFALVIWDARQQQAFCARDRMGNKPFTYHWNGSTLVFASEQQAILRQPAVPQVLNEGMVAEYLAAQWFSTTETLWQGILRLDAAHSMVVSLSGPTLSRYWAPDLQANLSFRSDEECAEHYRALLFDVVRRLSRSIAPLACEVSGGLDSSAIFTVADSLQRSRQFGAPGIEGYTLDFSGDPDADEIDYCRAVGVHLGRHIHEIQPAHRPLSWYVDTARHFCDFPEFPNGAMGLSIADSARASGSRVLLKGLGGDQWLCGSEMVYAEALAGWRGGELLNILKEEYQSFGFRTTVWRTLRNGIVPLLPPTTQQILRAGYVKFRRTSPVDGPPEWLAEPMHIRFQARRQELQPLRAQFLPRPVQEHQLAYLHDAYQRMAMEIGERLYAQAGLEVRQPYWNARIVEFALATPERSRLRGGEDKWLHRRAMKGLLPGKVLQRRDKAEFSVTFSQYWTEMAPHLTGAVIPRRNGWVSQAPVHAMLEACLQRDPSERAAMAMWSLWTLFCVDAVVRSADAAEMRSVDSCRKLTEP
jgi:asparagine synthase (glutamine-hydrolysing)